MKKLFTVCLALALCAGLAFAQATGGSTKTTESGKKATKTKSKGHKGGKKGKKSSGGTTTTAPK